MGVAPSRSQSNIKLRAGPSGLQLFERKTGLNELLDEVRVPSMQWARAPRQVSVALTNACDLDCSYCYAPKNPATLDATRLAGWLLELDDNGCFAVGFGGGEPTLHREFVKICRQTTERTRLAVTFIRQLAWKCRLVLREKQIRCQELETPLTSEQVRNRPSKTIKLPHRHEIEAI